MDWERIERSRGNEEVRPHPQDAALLQLRARLNRTPPPEWQDRFKYPAGHSALGYDAPTLDGNTVTIAVTDGEEKRGIALIDERIAGANREYERDVLPALRAQEEREKRRTEQETLRLEEAQKRLKDL
jgi:hypothetical protein